MWWSATGHLFPQQWHHVDNLKSAVIRVFKPWKLGTLQIRSFFPSGVLRYTAALAPGSGQQFSSISFINRGVHAPTISHGGQAWFPHLRKCFQSQLSSNKSWTPISSVTPLIALPSCFVSGPWSCLFWSWGCLCPSVFFFMFHPSLL